MGTQSPGRRSARTARHASDSATGLRAQRRRAASRRVGQAAGRRADAGDPRRAHESPRRRHDRVVRDVSQTAVPRRAPPDHPRSLRARPRRHTHNRNRSRTGPQLRRGMAVVPRGQGRAHGPRLTSGSQPKEPSAHGARMAATLAQSSHFEVQGSRRPGGCVAGYSRAASGTGRTFRATDGAARWHRSRDARPQPRARWAGARAITEPRPATRPTRGHRRSQWSGKDHPPEGHPRRDRTFGRARRRREEHQVRLLRSGPKWPRRRAISSAQRRGGIAPTSIFRASR